MDDYLEYRNVMVKPATLKRDKSALNQFRRFVGSSKAVEELSYRDIEGANGLIQHLRNKGCSDIGINTSLRHIRTYLNWLFEKEKLIPEQIKFKELKKGVQLHHYFNESETNQIFHYINEHMDSSYLRYYHFYNQTGMRPTEPFIGELVGNYYIIDAQDRKNGIPMQMQLNEELKSILLEMQSFRDTKLHCKDANVRVVDILERNIMRIVRALEFTGKRLTLYSFRHSYAIRRITMLNGNVFDVMREMGHTNTQTTMQYLRFPLERRLDDFPSLKDYIENRQNMPKNVYVETDYVETIYSSIPKLTGSIRN
jgi:integrase